MSNLLRREMLAAGGAFLALRSVGLSERVRAPRERPGARWIEMNRPGDPRGQGLWWFTDENRRFWSLSNNPLSPSHLGATGLGDEQGLLQHWASLLGDGRDGELGETYYAGREVVVSGKRDFTISGNGGIAASDSSPVASGHGILVFKRCSNFFLKDVTLDGRRRTRGGGEVAAHNIQFLSCQHFSVQGVHSVNAVCDAIYIASSTPENMATHCDTFQFRDCLAHNSFRQGLSLIQGRQGKFEKCTFSSSSGTAPAAGVDIESNGKEPLGSTFGLIFDECRFLDNDGYGLQVSGKNAPHDIEVTNSYFSDNKKGPILWGATSGIINNVNFNGRGDIRLYKRYGSANFSLR